MHSVLGAGPLILHKMSADGTRLLDEGREIYRGPVAEGPKLFKRHGWYYISLPEGGVGKGGQTVLRSRSVYGPTSGARCCPPAARTRAGSSSWRTASRGSSASSRRATWAASAT